VVEDRVMDKRWKQVADVLVNYSAEVQPGQRVMIAMGETASYPLVCAVYEAAVKAGACVQVQFLSESLRHSLMKYGTPEQVAWTPEVEAYGMDWADVYFGLRGAYNLYEHADVSSDILAASQHAMGEISKMRWEKTRWCLVRVPNLAFAQQAETNLETVTDMFFAACLIDWPARAEAWSTAARKLQQGSMLHIVGKDTDLSFSVAGRKWKVGAGKINMPDGEIYTAPVSSTLDGHICFEFPGVFGGRLIDEIRLSWKNGALVEATSSKNQEYLHKIIASDSGATLLGEFGFGVNSEINRFCKDILLDEKIGGTIHVALGRAYPECGGTNVSAIHWDIVKDLRREGVVELDGKPVFENGALLV
jgi:aminopeptidase